MHGEASRVRAVGPGNPQIAQMGEDDSIAVRVRIPQELGLGRGGGGAGQANEDAEREPQGANWDGHEDSGTDYPIYVPRGRALSKEASLARPWDDGMNGMAIGIPSRHPVFPVQSIRTAV
jgi:hypothetical protein